MLRVTPRTVEWMAGGEPWVVHNYGHQILDRPVGRGAAVSVLKTPEIRSLVHDVTAWPWRPLSSHKDSSHPIHKLTFLADLGLGAKELGIAESMEEIMGHIAQEGPPQVPMAISKAHGGSGESQFSWALCDAPLMLYSLVKLGYAEDERVRRGIEHLLSLSRSNGWPCAVSTNLGRFRGPGRKDDPCPYANMAMLKLLAQVAGLRDSEEARNGVEAALALWTSSRERHPYMFFMGTDFRKLKAPLVWYDLLHLVEVLSRFPCARDDQRLREMTDMICAKATEGGRFVPESIWLPWKDWDMGQKKQPSRGLTMMVHRAIRHMDLLELE